MLPTNLTNNSNFEAGIDALRLDGLCNGANLVDFEQQTVAGLLVNSLLDSLRIGHGQVISYNLTGRKSYINSPFAQSDAVGE